MWTVLVSALLLAGPLEEALSLEAAGQDAQAIQLLEAAVLKAPRQVELRLELARLRLKTGEQLQSAQLHLDSARVLAPQDPRPHWLWAALMEEQGKPWEAAKSLERVLVVKPDHPDARFRVASLYERLGDPLHAEHHYRRLARERPDWAVARVQLAVVLENQGRRDTAIQELEALLALDPGSTLGRRKLIELYERAGLKEKAAALQAPPAKTKLRPLKRSKR